MTETVRRALSAYYRSDSTVPDEQASGERTHNGKQSVVLERHREVLAVYRGQPNGLLRRMRRWPKAVEGRGKE